MLIIVHFLKNEKPNEPATLTKHSLFLTCPPPPETVHKTPSKNIFKSSIKSFSIKKILPLSTRPALVTSPSKKAKIMDKPIKKEEDTLKVSDLLTNTEPKTTNDTNTTQVSNLSTALENTIESINKQEKPSRKRSQNSRSRSPQSRSRRSRKHRYRSRSTSRHRKSTASAKSTSISTAIKTTNDRKESSADKDPVAATKKSPLKKSDSPTRHQRDKSSKKSKENLDSLQSSG